MRILLLSGEASPRVGFPYRIVENCERNGPYKELTRVDRIGTRPKLKDPNLFGAVEKNVEKLCDKVSSY